jgi:hypothetical protein
VVVVASWSSYKQADAGFGSESMLPANQGVDDPNLRRLEKARSLSAKLLSGGRSFESSVTISNIDRPSCTRHSIQSAHHYQSQCSASPSPDPPDASPRLLLESRPPSPAALLPHPSCLRPPPLPRPLFPPSDATRHTLVSHKMRFRAVSSTS